jgi:hypothetical protein
MTRPALLAALLVGLAAVPALSAGGEPPDGGRGAGSVPVWNPYRPAPGNPPLAVRVLRLTDHLAVSDA